MYGNAKGQEQTRYSGKRRDKLEDVHYKISRFTIKLEYFSGLCYWPKNW